MGPLQQQWVWSHPCHELECAAFAQLCIAEPGTALELRAAQSATIDLRRHFRLSEQMSRLITASRGLVVPLAVMRHDCLHLPPQGTEESRVGKACVSTCSPGGGAFHEKKKR